MGVNATSVARPTTRMPTSKSCGITVFATTAVGSTARIGLRGGTVSIVVPTSHDLTVASTAPTSSYVQQNTTRNATSVVGTMMKLITVRATSLTFIWARP